ncbi:peptidoglycan-binding protein [Aeromicrobium sp. UC242_57]|uniref:peptidoglycan-binding domain-containing protein n=1 Tax=Aeromicrobium sp. UC242_57 TaxID=3374624 RepID=UPI0037BFC6F5
MIAVCTLVLATGALAAPATAGEAPISLPASPTGLVAPVLLPDGLDPKSPYLPQSSCNPVDMAGTVKLRDHVLATYGQGGRGNISRGCTEGVSEHSEGRAWDWMIDPDDPAQTAAAADFLSWVTRDDGRNARRLGIMYVIYNKKIWSIYRSGEGWRRSSGHQDHIHVSLSWNGARGNVSFWTGKVGSIDYGPCVRFKGTYAALSSAVRSGSCAASSKLLAKTKVGNRQYGRTGSTVKKAQRLLGVKATGRFDSMTWSAVKRFQRAHDVPVTGVLDQPTWVALSPSSVTYRAVKGYSRARAIRYGLKNYSRTTLRKGRADRAVVFLQTALGLPRVDRNGYFGSVTVNAVKARQAQLGLKADGVVQGEEWKAMADALK